MFYRRFIQIIRGFFVVMALLGLALLQNCGTTAGTGGGSSTSGTVPTAGEAEASALAIYSTITASVMTLEESTSPSLSSPPLLSHLKNSPLTTTLSTSTEIECAGGSAGVEIDADAAFVSGDEGAVNIVGTVGVTFNDCGLETDITDDCLVEGTLNGVVTCDINLLASGEDLTGTFACTTTDACSGLTIDVDGTETTMGTTEDTITLSVVADVVELTQTGTVCVNDATYTDLNVFDAENFEPEDFSCQTSDEENSDDSDGSSNSDDSNESDGNNGGDVGDYYTSCTADSECTASGVGATCEGTGQGNYCLVVCSTDAACGTAFSGSYATGSLACVDTGSENVCMPACASNSDCSDYGAGLECDTSTFDAGVCL